MVPDFSVTMARLVSLRLPVPKRVRRALPTRLIVLTAATLTPKIFSMASLISVLVGAGVHEERVLALVDEPVALLGDDRLQDDVARVLVQGRLQVAHAETSSVAPLFDATNAS